MKHLIVTIMLLAGIQGVAHKRSHSGLKQYREKKEALALEQLKLMGE